MPDQISNKKTVFFTYSVIDATVCDEVLEQSDIPVGYVHGVPNQMFPKIERALKGKKVGDEISVTLTPDEHFGAHDSSKTFTDNISNVPTEYQSVGVQAQFKNEHNQTITMTVVKVTNDKVYLDGNHPFAGKNIIYHIVVREIREATADEIANGHPTQNHPYL